MLDKDIIVGVPRSFSTPEAGSRNNTLHITCNRNVSERFLEGSTFIEHCHVFRAVLAIDVIYQKGLCQGSPSYNHVGTIPYTL